MSERKQSMTLRELYWGLPKDIRDCYLPERELWLICVHEASFAPVLMDLAVVGHIRRNYNMESYQSMANDFRAYEWWKETFLDALPKIPQHAHAVRLRERVRQTRRQNESLDFAMEQADHYWRQMRDEGYNTDFNAESNDHIDLWNKLVR